VKKILYLGPEGSNTEIAMEKAICVLGLDGYEKSRVCNVKKIIETVDNNPDYMGVIPIENSIEGLVRETVDNIIRTKSHVKVFQEIILPICNCLIAKTTDITKITKVISHPQALAQCQNYIAEKLQQDKEKNIQLINSTSTSEAVKSLIDLDETYAAIGNQRAASLYGFNVLDTNINDEKDNKTRFVCIGYHLSTPTGFDRTSIAFSVCNKAGALVDVLTVFKENNINLSYIDSRPSKKNLGEYTFFVDFDGHIENENVMEVIHKISPFTTFYRFIGSYPKCKSFIK